MIQIHDTVRQLAEKERDSVYDQHSAYLRTDSAAVGQVVGIFLGRLLTVVQSS